MASPQHPVAYPEVANLPYTPPQQKLTYGEANQQTAEYWSAGEDSALLLLIHGGCWLNQFDADHVRPLASQLVELGVSVLSVEYRRLGDQGGGFPGTFDDIQSAAQLVATLPHDEHYVAGHSAGGHLALWLAATENPLKLKGAIGLAAISDLKRYALGTSGCERAAAALMGGSPTEQSERYQTASPIELSFDIPLLLLHGDQDPIVAIEQSQAFCQKHENCSLQTLQGLGHFDAIDPRFSVPELITDFIHRRHREHTP